MTRARAFVVALVLVLAGVALPAGTAAAAPEENCTTPPPVSDAGSWALKMLAPERIWPLTRGAGITVAVLASGVDANHPQLHGHVDAGYDATTDKPGANTDCLGLGTEVAGVIAAQAGGAGGAVYGVAPGVRIQPVRVVASGGLGPPNVDVGQLARGIKWAVDHQVDVICVAVTAYAADPQVQQQIRYAHDKGVAVVAAAGDQGNSRNGNPSPYPAAFADVIGVSALGPDGHTWSDTGNGPYVTVAAPGATVTTLARGTGLTTVDGTGVAAGFVAGSIALLLAHDGKLEPGVVLQKVIATATPPPVGPRSITYGYGTINPYRLVSERIDGLLPKQMTPLEPSPPSPEEQARADAWSNSARIALWLTGGVLVLVLVVLVAGAAVPRGRRRRWRPGLAAGPVERAEPEEPPPPVALFDDRSA
jgi:subtilisin family serine protease